MMIKVQLFHHRNNDTMTDAKNTNQRTERSRGFYTGMPPCSKMMKFHYSFDYAQQVHYPHYAQQVGTLFFKTPRKCQCFGVCAEGSGTGSFFLILIVEMSQNMW